MMLYVYSPTDCDCVRATGTLAIRLFSSATHVHSWVADERAAPARDLLLFERDNSHGRPEAGIYYEYSLGGRIYREMLRYFPHKPHSLKYDRQLVRCAAATSFNRWLINLQFPNCAHTSLA
jgi:hypothetical protein